jgi:predicted enzyme related to lactoylglutathione lyase
MSACCDPRAAGPRTALAAAIGAKAFYATVFGWSFQDFGEFTGSTYGGVGTGPEDKSGINDGLVKDHLPTCRRRIRVQWASMTTTRPSAA